MIVKVELRDKQFNILEILDSEFMGLSWEWGAIGGCGSFSFDLPRQYCDEKYISGDFNIRIYARNDVTNAYDLWFQGIVEKKVPSVKDLNEVISVQGHGYQAQLSRIQLNDVTYNSVEIGDIIKDLLDNYIVPATDISYDIGDIYDTGFVIDQINFNSDCLSAIQTLSDIAGEIEWGVDEQRKMYFLRRSDSVGRFDVIGRNINAFTDDNSFSDLVNRVIVQGGDVAGVPFRPDPTASPYNDISSQTKYGRHDQVYQNSSILTDEVAEKFAQAILREKSDVIRRARMELIEPSERIENTIPLPLVQIVSRGTLYGEKKYGTFLYSGKINYRIHRITYKISGTNGSLAVNMEMGHPRPGLPETISRLKYQLEQQRNQTI